jgi:hypothetical protein
MCIDCTFCGTNEKWTSGTFVLVNSNGNNISFIECHFNDIFSKNGSFSPLLYYYSSYEVEVTYNSCSIENCVGLI